MSNHRRSKITDATAEQLLSRQAEGGPPALHRMFAAASAAGSPAELAGEQAALAHFRAASLSPDNTARRRSLFKTAAAKLIAAKLVIGAGFAAAATGGIAVAAATNHLPGQQQHSGRVAPTTSASHSAAGQATSHPSSRPSSSPGLGAAHATSSATHPPKGTPSPSLTGLCTAFQAGAGDNPGKALENPAFTALITAAGGKDKVAAYCVTVLATAHPTAKASGPGTHPSAPSTHPGAPSTHPGAPSTHPSEPPSAPPTPH